MHQDAVHYSALALHHSVLALHQSVLAAPRPPLACSSAATASTAPRTLVSPDMKLSRDMTTRVKAQSLKPKASDTLTLHELLARPDNRRSVIVLVQYDKERGTFGLVVNRQVPLKVTVFVVYLLHKTKFYVVN